MMYYYTVKLLQKILSQAVVSVHIEVRPKYLVPDTNCFIDHLNKLRIISEAHVYTLMVSLVGKWFFFYKVGHITCSFIIFVYVCEDSL